MKTFPILSASLLLLSTTALANPIMVVQEISAQVVSGPHVKLTYTYNYGGPNVATHGTTHSPWVSAGSTSRDTGSGVKELPILRMCDCHVPTATTLDYRIVNGGMSPSAATQVSVPAQADLDKYVTGDDCRIPCQQADADAVDGGQTNTTGGAVGGGGATATGGAVGSGGATVTGGAVGSGGTTATGGAIGSGGSTASGAPVTQAKGSGCAFVAPEKSPALLCLALFAIAIAARRRRP